MSRQRRITRSLAVIAFGLASLTATGAHAADADVATSTTVEQERVVDDGRTKEERVDPSRTKEERDVALRTKEE